jgi:hypothetical protein
MVNSYGNGIESSSYTEHGTFLEKLSQYYSLIVRVSLIALPKVKSISRLLCFIKNKTFQSYLK